MYCRQYVTRCFVPAARYTEHLFYTRRISIDSSLYSYSGCITRRAVFVPFLSLYLYIYELFLCGCFYLFCCYDFFCRYMCTFLMLFCMPFLSRSYMHTFACRALYGYDIATYIYLVCCDGFALSFLCSFSLQLSGGLHPSVVVTTQKTRCVSSLATLVWAAAAALAYLGDASRQGCGVQLRDRALPWGSDGVRNKLHPRGCQEDPGVVGGRRDGCSRFGESGGDCFLDFHFL